MLASIMAVRSPLAVLLVLTCVARGAAFADDGPLPTSSIEGVVSHEGKPTAADVVAERLQELDPTDEVGVTPGLPGDTLRVPPVWGWRMPLLPLTGHAPFPTLRTRAGDDGRYRFDGLAPGTYFLRAVTASGPHATATVHVHAPGLRLQEGLATGKALPATLRGRLRHMDGRPFRGRVALVLELMGIWVFPGSVETDARGEFELPLRGEAPFGGILRVGAIVPERFAVLWPLGDASAFFERAIAPGTSRAAGRVLDASSGRAIAGATVWAESWAVEDVARFERTTTDAQGRSRLPRLDDARTHVVVTAMGYGFAVQEREQGGTFEIQMARASRIRGRLVPPPGVDLSSDLYAAVWHHPDALAFPAMAWTKPAADGRFDLGEFGPGQAVVYAFGGGWIATGMTGYVLDEASSLPHVLLHGSELHEVAVPVVRAASVRGRVRGPDGQGIAGARVSVEIAHGAGTHIRRNPPGWERSAGSISASRADGSFLLSGLIPGVPYEVRARAVGGLEGEADVAALATGEIGAVELRIAPPNQADRKGDTSK
jgi:protocatechuate 3,4-dioxygenase beta subunit